MRNYTNRHIALLNRKGKQYRKMILQMSDEELLKMFPAPSEKVLIQLRRKVVKTNRLWPAQN
ncbi:hypothetical protein [Geofilum rubicundum]|uniref:hypothetical protein n=1 Tax=Geofilum rubicundum TaxID=472113 RepID=UPI000780D5A6|nr:hypothetical protein [Geofilum rubicundum]